MAELKISAIPLEWTGPNLPDESIIPGTISGVTYRIPGSYFNTGGGGSQQIYESVSAPSSPPEDPNLPAIFLHRNGDINSAVSGTNITYIWDVITDSWKPIDGFTWSATNPTSVLSPTFRLQKHYEVSVTGGSGSESYLVNTYIAAVQGDADSWVLQ